MRPMVPTPAAASGRRFKYQPPLRDRQIGGIGELAIPTVDPAVVNAIANAVGVRLRRLPIDNEKLKKA